MRGGGTGRVRTSWRPGLLVAGFFLVTILLGTLLLKIPALHPATPIAWDEALFTSTSAVTVTGLSVVDAATGWTPLGKVVIALLIQIGGFGLATLATIMIMIVTRRLGLSTRLMAQSQTPWVSLGEIRQLVWFVIRFSVAAEAIIAVLLTLQWWLRYDVTFPVAAGRGVFHAISSFNNAGFSLFSDNYVGLARDPLMLTTTMAAIVVGGIGFPVYLQVRHTWRTPAKWSVHVRLTLVTTAVLIVVGAVVVTLFEWSNPATLADMSVVDRLVNGTFGSVTARTAGFNSFDYSQATEETLVATTILMFIGGGTASTAGGIKVTTFAVIMLAVLAEARGRRDVVAGRRRISGDVLRAALAVTVSYLILGLTGTLLLMWLSNETLHDMQFEAISAISTVGLSTGQTSDLNGASLLVLCVLMFVGRIGAMSMASAFALTKAQPRYRYPEGRPLIG